MDAASLFYRTGDSSMGSTAKFLAHTHTNNNSAWLGIHFCMEQNEWTRNDEIDAIHSRFPFAMAASIWRTLWYVYSVRKATECNYCSETVRMRERDEAIVIIFQRFPYISSLFNAKWGEIIFRLLPFAWGRWREDVGEIFITFVFIVH